MLFIFDTLHCLNFVWWSLLLELREAVKNYLADFSPLRGGGGYPPFR